MCYATSRRKVALFTGFSILMMALLAGFAYGYVLQGLIVSDNTTVTVNNIRSSMVLFRLAVLSFLVVLICDICAAWGLHVLLAHVNKNLSLLMAWFRLVYAAMLGVALLNFIFIILLLNGKSDSSVLETSQISAFVTLFLNAFFNIWSAGLVIFGCHLSLLGYLVIKSNYIPTMYGILLIIAALCYMISNVANLLLSDYEKYKETVESFISLPLIVGELGFGLWLLFRGGLTNEFIEDENKKTD